MALSLSSPSSLFKLPNILVLFQYMQTSQPRMYADDMPLTFAGNTVVINIDNKLYEDFPRVNK